MASYFTDWIDDEPEDEQEPDLSFFCSDPVGLVADQCLAMIDSMRAEGFSRREIAAGLALANADLTSCLVEEREGHDRTGE